ncbi:MAG: hypothetical protein Q8R28_22300, partial [Dehalococcoidia bacterium]|nr:hypothetical protein [Dehalococcoidia bacterium]
GAMYAGYIYLLSLRAAVQEGIDQQWAVRLVAEFEKRPARTLIVISVTWLPLVIRILFWR